MGKSVYNSVLSFPVRDESGSFYYFLDESGFSGSAEISGW
jgi:hypothetical protein